MSIDLFLYSPNTQVVRREELIKALEARGWNIIITSESDNKVVSSGPLGHYDTVCGAHSAATVKQIAEHLENEKVLKDIFDYEECGICGIHITQPYDILKEYSAGELLVEEKADGPEIAEHKRQTKIFYYIRAHHLSNLQGDIWESLGELAGGLLEEPQGGAYILLNRTGKKVLSTPEDKETRPFAIALYDFYKQAELNGFPVEQKPADTVIPMEKLSKEEVERLLKLAKKCFRDKALRDDELDLSMIDSILSDYIRSKGRDFAKAESEWINSMRQKYLSPQGDISSKTFLIMFNIIIALVLILFLLFYLFSKSR